MILKKGKKTGIKRQIIITLGCNLTLYYSVLIKTFSITGIIAIRKKIKLKT